MSSSRAVVGLIAAAFAVTIAVLGGTVVAYFATAEPDPVMELWNVAPVAGDITVGDFSVLANEDDVVQARLLSLPDQGDVLGITGEMCRLTASDQPVLVQSTGAFEGSSGIQSQRGASFTLTVEEPIGCRPFFVPLTVPQSLVREVAAGEPVSTAFQLTISAEGWSTLATDFTPVVIHPSDAQLAAQFTVADVSGVVAEPVSDRTVSLRTLFFLPAGLLAIFYTTGLLVGIPLLRVAKRAERSERQLTDLVFLAHHDLSRAVTLAGLAHDDLEDTDADIEQLAGSITELEDCRDRISAVAMMGDDADLSTDSISAADLAGDHYGVVIEAGPDQEPLHANRLFTTVMVRSAARAANGMAGVKDLTLRTASSVLILEGEGAVDSVRRLVEMNDKREADFVTRETDLVQRLASSQHAVLRVEDSADDRFRVVFDFEAGPRAAPVPQDA